MRAACGREGRPRAQAEAVLVLLCVESGKGRKSEGKRTVARAGRRCGRHSALLRVGCFLRAHGPLRPQCGTTGVDGAHSEAWAYGRPAPPSPVAMRARGRVRRGRGLPMGAGGAGIDQTWHQLAPWACRGSWGGAPAPGVVAPGHGGQALWRGGALGMQGQVHALAAPPWHLGPEWACRAAQPFGVSPSLCWITVWHQFGHVLAAAG